MIVLQGTPDDLARLTRRLEALAPEGVAVALNRRWAREAARTAKAKFNTGNYLKARTGRTRDRLTAVPTKNGAILRMIGPGAVVLEHGTDHLPGGVIRPKRGHYLRFRNASGTIVYARSVRIRGRHQIRDAGDETTARLEDFVTEVLREHP